MTAGTTTTAFPPHTRVRIIGGTSKTKGKDGFIGTDKPDYRNLGKLPILVGHQNKRVWCKPEWLQPYNETKSEPEAQFSSDPELQPEDQSQPIEDEETGTLTSPLGYVLDPASCEPVNYPVVHDPVEQEPLTKYLALELIATDGGTQSRAGLNYATIDEYAEAMDAGAQFPPVLVFYDGEEYWLADGFHRVEAASRLEWTDIAVEIRSGTRRDAVLYSVGANAEHGLRRTNADKRQAVLTLLNDDEWGQWSNREIAKRVSVAEGLVRKIKEEVSAYNAQIDLDFAEKCGSTVNVLENVRQKLTCSSSPTRTVLRGTKTYTQDTTKIGKKLHPTTDSYQKDGVYMIQAKSNPDLRRFDGEWAIVKAVNEYSITIALRRENIELTH